MDTSISLAATKKVPIKIATTYLTDAIKKKSRTAPIKTDNVQDLLRTFVKEQEAKQNKKIRHNKS